MENKWKLGPEYAVGMAQEIAKKKKKKSPGGFMKSDCWAPKWEGAKIYILHMFPGDANAVVQEPQVPNHKSHPNV